MLKLCSKLFLIFNYFRFGECARVNDALFTYSMKRFDCLNKSISDDIHEKLFGSLKINDALIGCPYSNGILPEANKQVASSPPIISNSYSSAFSDKAGDSDISIEIWFQSGLQNVRGSNILLSIGKAKEDSLQNSCNYNLQLHHSQNRTSGNVELYLKFCIEEDIVTVKRKIRTTLTMHRAVINHAVLAIQFPLNGVVVNFTINGKPAGHIYTEYTGGGDFASLSPKNWDRLNKLFLLPDAYYSIGSTWNGTLYMVAAYSRSLSLKEIQQNYDEGISNSVPVVWDGKVTVQEGGEVGDHHATPVYYRNELAHDQLVALNLPL